VNDVEIRPAQPADIPKLAAFLVGMEHEHGGATNAIDVARDLERLHAGPEFLLAVAADGAIAGLAAYSLLYPSSGSGLSQLLYLKELHVAPDFRRQGLARKLMARLAKIARERGCPRLGWTTGHDNIAAQGLYDGLGAERAEWLLSYRLGGEALERLAELAD
jgi:ribosomal protein S18 acetylase RimI-like enzyme